METLSTLRLAADDAYVSMRRIISQAFPGCDEYHWYRAVEHMAGNNFRRNDDTSRDAELAAHEGVKTAHDNYITALHRFYARRDGPNGFLGGRGA